MNQQNLETIKKIIEEFFQKISFEAMVEISQKEKTIFIDLKTEEPQILIGEKGQTLAEIQRLLKLILRKKTGEQSYIDLDINGYKQKKYEYLREMAGLTADEVALSKREKALAPMPAYERRVVHLHLAGRKDVVSESIGQADERRIIIKPSPSGELD